MKLFFNIILIFFLSIIFSSADAQTWLWGRGAIGNGHDEGKNVATDASGNVFLTGSFNSQTIVFGSYTLTSAAGDQVFLAKYNSGGNVLWAVCGVGNGTARAAATDASGNSYITGTFNGTINFGTYTLNNGGVFLVKYDVNGNVIWAKKAGLINDNGYDVATDTSGNIYVAGFFYSSSITFGTYTLTNSGGNTPYDIFLAKYDSAGNVLWAKKGGGVEGDFAYGVATDPTGNIYVTGYLSSTTATFGSFTVNGIGIFLAKYDAAGNEVWVSNTANNDEGDDVAADAFGNVYVASDAYILSKYNSSGNLIWTQPAVGADFGASVDPFGYVYVSGRFGGTIVLGHDTFIYPSGPPADPMFVAKFDSSGTVICAVALSSGGDDRNGVAADPFGNAYTGGDYQNNPVVVGPDTLPNAPDESIFVAKFTCGKISSEVAELSNEKKSIVFPNPFSDYVTIKVDIQLTNATLKIYDQLGREIKTRNNISGKEILLDRNDLPGGIYFIRLIEDNKVIATDKLIISDN